jgi:hypothetical protein
MHRESNHLSLLLFSKGFQHIVPGRVAFSALIQGYQREKGICSVVRIR